MVAVVYHVQTVLLFACATVTIDHAREVAPLLGVVGSSRRLTPSRYDIAEVEARHFQKVLCLHHFFFELAIGEVISVHLGKNAWDLARLNMLWRHN